MQSCHNSWPSFVATLLRIESAEHLPASCRQEAPPSNVMSMFPAPEPLSRRPLTLKATTFVGVKAAGMGDAEVQVRPPSSLI